MKYVSKKNITGSNVYPHVYMLMEKCRKIIVGLNLTQSSYLYFVKHADIKGAVKLFIDLIT